MRFEERIEGLKQYKPEAKPVQRLSLVYDESMKFSVADPNVKVFYSGSRPSYGLWWQSADRDVRIFVSTGQANHRIDCQKYDTAQSMGEIHRHDYIEIGYVVKGCARQRFSDKVYTFPEGSFWLSDRNCVHADCPSEAELLTAFVIVPTAVFDAIISELGEDTVVKRFLITSLQKQKNVRQFLCFNPFNHHQSAKALMESICHEIDGNLIGSSDVIRGLLARFLVTLSSDYEISLYNQNKMKMSQLIFKDIEKYIKENYHNIVIQDLVDQFHYNEDFYNRLIKEYSGYTYSGYVQNLRLLESEALLKDTKIPIGDIIRQVGYHNTGYFYKIFQEKNGMIPSQYRKEKRGQ